MVVSLVMVEKMRIVNHNSFASPLSLIKPARTLCFFGPNGAVHLRFDVRDLHILHAGRQHCVCLRLGIKAIEGKPTSDDLRKIHKTRNHSASCER